MKWLNLMLINSFESLKTLIISFILSVCDRINKLMKYSTYIYIYIYLHTSLCVLGGVGGSYLHTTVTSGSIRQVCQGSTCTMLTCSALTSSFEPQLRLMCCVLADAPCLRCLQEMLLSTARKHVSDAGEGLSGVTGLHQQVRPASKLNYE